MPLLTHRGSSAFVPRMFLRNSNALQRQDRQPTTVALTQVEALADRKSKELRRDPSLIVSGRENDLCNARLEADSSFLSSSSCTRSFPSSSDSSSAACTSKSRRLSAVRSLAFQL